MYLITVHILGQEQLPISKMHLNQLKLVINPPGSDRTGSNCYRRESQGYGHNLNPVQYVIDALAILSRMALQRRTDWTAFTAKCDERSGSLIHEIITFTELDNAAVSLASSIGVALQDTTKTILPTTADWLPHSIRNIIKESRRTVKRTRATLAPKDKALANI